MDAIRHAVELIGRDRQGIANAGVTVASRLAGQAMRYTVNALRYGHDPVNAANAVLLGNNDTTHANAIDVLAQVMVVSNLKGRRRSVLNAGSRMNDVSLARSDADRAQGKLTDTEKSLIALLLLDDDEIQLLHATYGPIAQRLLEEATVPLVDRIEGVTDAPGIRGAFNDSGFGADDPYALRNIFTTAGVRGYEDGRNRIWDVPVVREQLWGFHYSAILDDHTTELCTTLDGTVAPKDDPFWKRFSPPNHFRCRSTLIEVWRSDALNEPSVIQTSATPEQLDRFISEKRRFLGYF